MLRYLSVALLLYYCITYCCTILKHYLMFCYINFVLNCINFVFFDFAELILHYFHVALSMLHYFNVPLLTPCYTTCCTWCCNVYCYTISKVPTGLFTAALFSHCIIWCCTISMLHYVTLQYLMLYYFNIVLLDVAIIFSCCTI